MGLSRLNLKIIKSDLVIALALFRYNFYIVNLKQVSKLILNQFGVECSRTENRATNSNTIWYYYNILNCLYTLKLYLSLNFLFNLFFSIHFFSTFNHHTTIIFCILNANTNTN